MELKTPLEGLCKTCIDPGVCCRALVLPIQFPFNLSREEVREHVHMGTSPYPGPEWLREPLPMFDPIRVSIYHAETKAAAEPQSVVWRYECTALDKKSGRCTIYGNQPDVCAKFVAGSNPLCVHYDGDWSKFIKVYAKPMKVKKTEG